MTTLRELGEFGLIRRLTQHLAGAEGLKQGIGDDCAVLSFGDKTLLVTCDLSVEDVHFQRNCPDTKGIGYKVTAAAISDIAAMGGKPLYVFTSLAFPVSTPVELVDGIYGGIEQAVAASGATIAGGDITQSLARIVIDVMVIGEAVDNRYLLRSTAKEGDLLVVTGYPGCSAAGLLALQNGLDLPEFIQAHLYPQPRIAEGQWLAHQTPVHAMIDISDGLIQDAGHLADNSGIGVDIDPDALPVSPVFEKCREAVNLHNPDLILAGGEDYELAFAVDPAEADAVLSEFRKLFLLPVTVVGEFTGQWTGARVSGEAPGQAGFDHFRL
jgi:thiamine-monophosphate kinase